MKHLSTIAVAIACYRDRNHCDLVANEAARVLMDDAFMAVHYPAVISSTAANKVPSIFTEPDLPGMAA